MSRNKVKDGIYNIIGVPEDERVVEDFLNDVEELSSVKGIGEGRAEKLWKNGIRSIEDLKNSPERKLKEVLGEKTGSKVSREVSSPFSEH